MRLSTAVGWNEQTAIPAMNGSPTFRERQVRFGRKVCEAKELIRKVAAPGSAGRSLVKPFEPRRPGGQVEREQPTADDYLRRERRQQMTWLVRRRQAAHNRDYRWSSTRYPSRLRREAVAQWGQAADPDETTTQPLRRLPCDATYQRVRAYLRPVMDEPVFMRPGQEPGDRR